MLPSGAPVRRFRAARALAGLVSLLNPCQAPFHPSEAHPAASLTETCSPTPIIAEPKLDERRRFTVKDGRAVACYSRDLLCHRGLRWLRDVRWPIERAVIAGELYSGDGAEGIDAIFAARQQVGSAVVFAALDVLAVGDHEVMSEPWTDRRKRLEDIFPAGVTDSRVQLVPTFEDASRLWHVWVVEWPARASCSRTGAQPTSPVRGRAPGGRPSTSWCSRSRWPTARPSWCRGVTGARRALMAVVYCDPRSGEQVTVEQAIRVPHSEEWTPRPGPAEVFCWGVLRSGLLRHPVWVGLRVA